MTLIERAQKLIELLGVYNATIDLTDMDDNEYSFNVKEIAKRMIELEEQNEKFRNALEFYANSANWGEHQDYELSVCFIDRSDHISTKDYGKGYGFIEEVGGKRAQKALAETDAKI